MRFSFILYLVALVFGIAFFGAVHAWVYNAVFLMVLGATVPVLLSLVRRDYRLDRLMVHLPAGPWVLLFVVVALLLLLQMIPLPAAWVEAVSPAAALLQRQAARFDLVAGPVDSTLMTLAPYPFPVRLALVRWLVYGFFFFGLVQCMPTRKRITALVVVLAAAGLADMLYGMVQTYGGANHIFWYAKRSRDLTGTYINRNHFAGLMAMVLFVTSIAVVALGRGRRSHAGVTWKKRLQQLAADERLTSRRVMLFFAAVLIGLGLLLSASRGGIIAAGAGLLVAGTLLAIRKSSKKSGRIFVFLCLVIAVYGFGSGLDYTIGRFLSFGQGLDVRSRYAYHTMELAAAYPLAGVGVGLFRYAYPAWQSDKDKNYYIDYAHNDWAQLVAEIGRPGFAAVLLLVIVALIRHLRTWRRRRDRYIVAMGVAGPAALAAMAVHSWSDFNLHIPANFMTLAAVVAVSTAALANRKRRSAERFEPDSLALPLRGAGGMLLLALLCVTGWSGVVVTRSLAAESNCGTVHNSTLNRQRYPEVEAIDNAILRDPGNAAYWFRLAEVHMRRRDRAMRVPLDQATETALKKAVVNALEQTVRRNPLDGRIWTRLAWEYTFFWQEPDYHRKWLPMADLAMDLAVSRAGSKYASLHEEVGAYWIMRSRQTDPTDNQWQECQRKAVRAYMTVLRPLQGKAREKTLTRIEQAVWRHYPADSEVARQILSRFY